MKTSILFAVSVLLVLAGCGEPKKNYADAAHCHDLGYDAGTPEYDKCLREERQSRMLEQQRKEFDQMKQDQRDYQNRRY